MSIDKRFIADVIVFFIIASTAMFSGIFIHNNVITNDEPDVIDRTRVVHHHEHTNVTPSFNVTTNATIEYQRRSVPSWRIPDGHIDYDDSGITVDADTWGEMHGNSMHPLLPSGSTIASIDYDGQELERGYIVRYSRGDDIVVHMIVSVYDDCVRMYGINNREYDGCIDKDRVESIVVFATGVSIN